MAAAAAGCGAPAPPPDAPPPPGNTSVSNAVDGYSGPTPKVFEDTSGEAGGAPEARRRGLDARALLALACAGGVLFGMMIAGSAGARRVGAASGWRTRHGHA